MVLVNLKGAIILLLYYLVVCATLPTILKMTTKTPTEVVRKLQHVAYSLSIFILLQLFTHWYMAILGASLLVILGYPSLYFLEKTSLYKRLLVDRTRKGGELRRQLLYVQLSFALLIFFFWGILGTDWQYIVAVSVMAWGFGDAAAALVGKFFGKRCFVHNWIEGAKTYEGTTAMIIVAAIAAFLSLYLYGKQPWYVALLSSIVVAPVCGLVELFSWKGMDTLTVPLSAASLLLPLAYLFSLIP